MNYKIYSTSIVQNTFNPSRRKFLNDGKSVSVFCPTLLYLSSVVIFLMKNATSVKLHRKEDMACQHC